MRNVDPRRWPFRIEPRSSSPRGKDARLAASVRLRRAFTLLELLIVLALIALISATVMLRLMGPHQAAVARQAVEQWTTLDRQVRHQSNRFRRPAALTFRLQESSINRRTLGSRRDDAVVELAGGVRIDRFLGVTSGDVRRRREVAIRFNSRGQTNTYAVRLAGPGQLESWLLVLGLTGEVHLGLSEDEVHEALRLSAK